MNVSLYASNGNISRAEQMWANDWRENAHAQSNHMPRASHPTVMPNSLINSPPILFIYKPVR